MSNILNDNAVLYGPRGTGVEYDARRSVAAGNDRALRPSDRVVIVDAARAKEK